MAKRVYKSTTTDTPLLKMHGELSRIRTAAEILRKVVDMQILTQPEILPPVLLLTEARLFAQATQLLIDLEEFAEGNLKSALSSMEAEASPGTTYIPR